MTNPHFFRRWKDQLSSVLTSQTSIAPLVVLRITFGAIMFISTVRFIWKGWIVAYYVKPVFNFTYYGFEWAKPLGETGMFVLFYSMALAALLVMSGLFYRLATVIFFLCFMYAELIDKTTYLNHYYFVSIVSFLLIWVPAHRYFSLDVWRKPSLKVTHVPAWYILIFKCQLFLVYFFAGLAKINCDWLIDAMPLRIWLPRNAQISLIGPLLGEEWVAYLCSWFGLIFDLLIGFVLFNRRTVYFGYFFVFVFHAFTALLFPIGMFPYIMMSVTIVFFSDAFHQAVIRGLQRMMGIGGNEEKEIYFDTTGVQRRFVYTVMVLYFILQVFLPLRYLLYPGHLFWTEEGFRYSWRVMLMEKTGVTFFHIKDSKTGGDTEVINSDYLTPFQERMMSTQPDMILQYAHFLADTYRAKGMNDPIVTAECYVVLNGAPSQLFIDKQVNLAKERESFRHKTWILPFVHPKFVTCD